MYDIARNSIKSRKGLKLSEHITRSNKTPLSKEDVKSSVINIKIKFAKSGKAYILGSMSSWVQLNNLGDYQHNHWTRVIIDHMFKRNLGSWFPINQNLSTDQLVDEIMGSWSKIKVKNK